MTTGDRWLALVCLVGIGNQVRLALRLQSRAKTLREFADDYEQYIKQADQALRGRIAGRQIEVQGYLDDLGVGTVTQLPPPALAGARPPIELRLAMEALNIGVWTRGLDTTIHNAVLQAHGEYRRRSISAFWGILNPLVWAKHLILQPLMKAPFLLADELGLDRHRIEASLAGRVLKVLLALIGAMTSALGAAWTLEEIGVLPTGWTAEAVGLVLRCIPRR